MEKFCYSNVSNLGGCVFSSWSVENLLGVLLLFKISRNLVESKLTSCDLDPVHTAPDPYRHHINLKSLQTSTTLQFVIILQLKRIIEKVVRLNITVN